jgi:hypothetical protein
VLIGMLLGGALASGTFNIGFEVGMNLSTVDGLEGASRSRGTGRSLRLVEVQRALPPLHGHHASVGQGREGRRSHPVGDPTLDPIWRRAR